MLTSFDVPTLWIASPEKSIAQTIAAFLRPFLGAQIPHQFDEAHVCALRTREEIHSILNSLDKSVLLNTAFVLDLTGSHSSIQFDVRADSSLPLHPAELLLRYPEVYWIFVVDGVPDWHAREPNSSNRAEEGCISGAFREVGISPHLIDRHFVRIDRLTDLATRLKAHAEGFRTIFDPTGIRFLITAASTAEPPSASGNATLGLPDIAKLKTHAPVSYGISIEDEVNYALLNGYLLYKHGHSTFAITTLAEFRRLGEYTAHDNTPGRLWHVMEDVELSFPDATEADYRTHALFRGNEATDTALLASRSERYPILRNAGSRTVLTTVRLDPTSLRDSCGPNCNTLTKPHGGFYDENILAILDHPSTTRMFGHPRFITSILVSLQPLFFLLVGGQWLLRKVEMAVNALKMHYHRIFRTQQVGPKPTNPSVPTHSAPGVNQEIACHLLRRCRRSSQSIATAEDAIQCAVLAHVAYSLLGKKTQHTALEALCLQHQMEVHAECMFIGTSNALDVKPRLSDLEQEVAEITGVRHRDDFHKTWKRNQQRCNALLEICADLRNVYQIHDQREEENTLLRAFRSWQRLAFINGTREWTNWPLSWKWVTGTARSLLSLPWAYVNCLIGSGVNLVSISVVWVFLFAGIYGAVLGRYLPSIERDFMTWQSRNPATPGRTVSLPNLQIRSQVEDLKLDYLGYWLPQSAATFVGMHQYLQGGPHAGLLSDFVAASSVNGRAHPVAATIAEGQRHLDRFRRILKVWWYTSVAEMMLGYIHLASAVTLLLARFSRK